MKKNILLLLPILLLSGCNKETSSSLSNNSNINKKEFIKAKFKNFDDTILEETIVEKGKSAVYTKEAPLRPTTDKQQYIYSFSGWDKDLNNINENSIIKPTYQIIDKSSIVNGDYEYRKMYNIIDKNLKLIGYELYKYNNFDFDRELTIPETYLNLPILRIGEACFMDANVNKINLPSTIEVIESYAFNSCYNLESVNIPSKTKVIHYSAFYASLKLKKINLNNVIFLGENNLHLCPSLENIKVNENNSQFISNKGILYYNNAYDTLVKVPENIISISFLDSMKEVLEGSLSRLVKIEEVTLPKRIKELPKDLFREAKIKKITIEGKVRTISENAFHSCLNLKEVVLNENVETIKDRAFYKCEKLEKINFPDSLVSIGEFAFAYCLSLKEFHISENLENINYGALDEQDSLEKFTIDERNNYFKVFDDCLYSYDLKELLRVPQKKTNINYSNKIETIGSGSFYKCQNLREINLPNTINHIQDYAFYFVNQIYNLTIPDSVLIIDEAAFVLMENLSEIKLPKDL